MTTYSLLEGYGVESAALCLERGEDSVECDYATKKDFDDLIKLRGTASPKFFKYSPNITFENTTSRPIGQNTDRNSKTSAPKKILTTTQKPKKKKYSWIIILILGLWILSGFIAFLYSLTCFGTSSTNTDKIIGVLLALCFGPFYFIYLYFNTSYCRKKKSQNTNNFRRN